MHIDKTEMLRVIQFSWKRAEQHVNFSYLIDNHTFNKVLCFLYL